ncbi:MAG: hypothetical protein ACQESF_04615 [Nanobdellota archaeon]
MKISLRSFDETLLRITPQHSFTQQKNLGNRKRLSEKLEVPKLGLVLNYKEDYKIFQ